MSTVTRIMGDATHANVAALAAAGPWDLVAGYDTGSPGIDWTPADVALFTCPVLMIDQGYTGSPNLAATIRDVENGAWGPGQAVSRAGWDVPRPTIYCTTGEAGYNLAAVLADGWQGDLWLAIPGWQPGQPLPAAPGCTIVAVQNVQGMAGAYDSSVVLDPVWPAAAANEGDLMLLIRGADGAIYLLSGGRMHHVIDPASVAVYTAGGVQLLQVDAAEEAGLLADFPPGNPAVTVTVAAAA